MIVRDLHNYSRVISFTLIYIITLVLPQDRKKDLSPESRHKEENGLG